MVLGEGARYKVVYHKSYGKRILTEDGSRDHVSVNECNNPVGNYTSPFCIFSGKQFMEGWFDNLIDGEDDYFAVTETGYSNSYLALKWLEKVFKPETSLIANGTPSHLQRTCEQHHLWIHRVLC